MRSGSDTCWGSAMASEATGPRLAALRGRLLDADMSESTLFTGSTMSSNSERFRLREGTDVELESEVERGAGAGTGAGSHA